MDLDEWEVVSDDGFLEINDDGGNKIYSRKYICDSNNNSVFQDYFSCSAPNPTQFVDSTIVSGQSGAQTIPYSITVPERIVPDCFHCSNPVSKQIIPIQIQLDPKIDDEEVTKEVITSTQEVPFEINMLPSTIAENIKSPVAMNLETEQDQVLSQVFFKKMNMKVESPKSSNIKNFVTQIDAAADPFQYEEKDNKKVEMEDNKGGLKVLNWSLNGIGAICSFGVAAAATVCIIFIGNRQKHKQNQMLRFQIFSDDKRMKQVVHHASKLNEAMSAVRGVPITRAHITVGGYYDAV